MTMTQQPGIILPALKTSPLFNRPTRIHRATGRAFDRATWQAFAFNMGMLAVGIAGFTYAVTAVSLGLSVAILVFGLPVAAGLILGGRYLGNFFRHFTNITLGTSIPAPVKPTYRKGFWGFVGSALTDATAWRALGYMVLTFITSILAFSVTTTFLSLGAGGATYALWYRFLPMQQADDGTWHQGAQMWPNQFIDTPQSIFLLTAICLLIFLYVWPALNNFFAKMQASLAASLLGPTSGSLRNAELENQKIRTAETSAQHMRNIERDLHDVTQAQLVAIAMKVGDVKERLAAGETAEQVLGSLESTHNTAKSALTDLRGIVQGIHPAALNDGLTVALRTLAANSAVNVELDIELPADIAPAVEAAAYYSVAELLNNVAKHSGVNQAYVGARAANRILTFVVLDEGRGGAIMSDGAGTGLAGPGLSGAGLAGTGLAEADLAGPDAAGDGDGPGLGEAGAVNSGTGLAGVAQRVKAVNGNLFITSPVGGPTQIQIDLPQFLEAHA